MTKATETENDVGRPRTISDEALAHAVELYEGGMSVPRIAAQSWCKVSPATLYYHFRGGAKGDAVVELRGRGRAGLNDDQLAVAVAAYENGATLGEIRMLPELTWRETRDGARKTRRFSLPTISKALKAAGFEVKRGRPALAEVEEEEAA